MNPVLIISVVLMSVAIGWAIGANDAANSLGTAVGSKVITLKQAILLICLFGFLGALLQGDSVAKTIGKGIVAVNELDPKMSLYVALVSMFSACCWVVLATYKKIPISTSHSIVGAVAGSGLAIKAVVKWNVLQNIFICWIFTPLGAAILGYIFFRVFRRVFLMFVPYKYMKVFLTTLVIISGCYVAFSWGANDVANATGLMMEAKIFSPKISIIIGAAAILLGITTWGYKVIETIGSNITHLVPLMAFSAQLASAVNVHIYTILGIPVSTSHSIVGAIFGIGLVKGMRVLNLKIARDMVICWLATPFISGVMSFLLFKLISVYVKF